MACGRSGGGGGAGGVLVFLGAPTKGIWESARSADTHVAQAHLGAEPKRTAQQAGEK